MIFVPLMDTCASASAMDLAQKLTDTIRQYKKGIGDPDGGRRPGRASRTDLCYIPQRCMVFTGFPCSFK
jgi:hypothetical protein